MKAVAERVGNRIYLRVPYSEMNVMTCKQVPGARWSKQAKAWTYPLDLETGRALREAFGEQLVLGPELTKWGQEAKALEQKLLGVNNVQDINVMSLVNLPRVSEVCPGMWSAMNNRPYQPVASLFMAMAGQCLNADQPGTGKTIETLAALIERGVTGPVLVLAPRTSVRSVWEPEIRQWLATYKEPWSVTVAIGSAKQVEHAYNNFIEEPWHDGLHFLVVNAEQARIKRDTECPADICNGDEDWCPEKDRHKNRSTVRKPFLHNVEWSAIVADETHRWLINTRGKSASQVGYGFTRLKTKEDGARYALTGTPLKGKKYNLFGTLNWLKPKVYTAKWRWIGTYFDVWDNEYGGKVIGDLKGGMSDEAFFRSLGSIVIRRTKDELRAINPAWMPPEKRYHDIWVDLEGTQRTHYRSMEKAAEAQLEGGTLQARGILAEMTRLKQFALSDGHMVDGTFKPTLPSAKYDWVKEFLSERGIGKDEMSDEVHKVVICSQFTSVLNVWADKMREDGLNPLMITGETKNPEVMADWFQTKDQYRLMLINTKAGGVSITLDAADDLVIIDETWVPDEQEQVEDRIHRASNILHQCDIWYVRSRGTIEEGIAAANRDKAEANHVVLDAKRGLKFAAERFGTTIKKEK